MKCADCQQLCRLHTKIRSAVPNGYNYPVQVHACAKLNDGELTVVDSMVERECTRFEGKTPKAGDEGAGARQEGPRNE